VQVARCRHWRACEAPATVFVVTARHRARGYLVRGLLHDLPVRRLAPNGEIYAHVYQRGFRSITPTATSSWTAPLCSTSAPTPSTSRQYPLSNLSVEVVYGPASTMYGANAYTG
jgi:hypothetical protein